MQYSIKHILEASSLTDMIELIDHYKNICVCTECGSNVDCDDFRDKQALKEWSISAMCQSCQDKY